MGTTDIDRSVFARRGTWDHRELVRELASGDFQNKELGQKYGVTGQAIGAFARRYAGEIDAVRGQMEGEFSGLWIADKVSRVIAYQRDYELSNQGEYAGHYEQIKARTAILRAVAEELGDLPPRATVTVVPVQHVIVGVDLNALT